MTDVTIQPLAGALGAEVSGVDLARLSNAQFAALHDAFIEHHVLVFRGQDMTPDQHLDFGRRFGTLDIAPFVKPMDGHPEIIEVVKEPEDQVNFGGGWHSDFSFKPEPPLGSILYAREVPPVGGDTMFANLEAAYDALSDGMKSFLGRLRAVHSPVRAYSAAAIARKSRKSMTITADDTSEATYTHPLVRVHAESGRKCLFVNDTYTIGIDGWNVGESAPLLKFLGEHAVRPEFTCRVRWEQDTVVFWDNRCLLHNALNDYPGHRRHMQRVTVVGEAPLAA